MLFPHTAAGRAEKSNLFLRQRHRVIHKAAGLAFKYNGNTIRAGVGAHNTTQLEHQQRRMTKLFLHSLTSSSRLAVELV